MITSGTLELKSVISELSKIDSLLNEMHLAGFPEDRLFDLRLLLSEALTNAILHGNKSKADREVYLKWSVEQEGTNVDCEVKIYDEGPGFEIAEIADPLAPVNLETPGGRGVFLIKRIADECFFCKKEHALVIRFSNL